MTTEEYIKLLENNNKFYEEYKKNYLKADILQRRINKAIIEIKKRSSKEVADLYISILKGDDKE